MKQLKTFLFFLLSLLFLHASPTLAIEQTPSGITLNITEENGNETLYELSPNKIEKTQTINNQTFTQEYSYNDKGKLISQTYPSGKTIGYSYNPQGELTSISIDGTAFITDIQTNQNGLLSYSYADSTTHAREYDT